MTPNLISVKKLAERLSVPEATIYSWKRQGKIPYVQLEGVIRFDEAEIAEWIKQRRRGKVGQEDAHGQPQKGLQ